MDQKVEGLVIGGTEQTSGGSEARPLNAGRGRRRRWYRRSQSENA